MPVPSPLPVPSPVPCSTAIDRNRSTVDRRRHGFCGSRAADKWLQQAHHEVAHRRENGLVLPGLPLADFPLGERRQVGRRHAEGDAVVGVYVSHGDGADLRRGDVGVGERALLDRDADDVRRIDERIAGGRERGDGIVDAGEERAARGGAERDLAEVAGGADLGVRQAAGGEVVDAAGGGGDLANP